MQIGVIGGGNVGTAFAKRLGKAGHKVMLSFSTDMSQLDANARRYGAIAGTPKDAAKFGEVVVLAVPWSAVELALQQAGSLDGKVLWDCTNALKPDYSGMAVGTTTSGAEIIAGLARGARVVKAIPPAAQLLMTDEPTVERRSVTSLVCSDDSGAKAIVMPLVSALPAHPVDFGPLVNARYAEPAMMAIVQLAFGLKRGYRIGFSFLWEPS
jgi:8-hydroxy-5-deazaflavin:NADPH oxidoreductase